MIKALIEIGRSIRDLYPIPLVEVPYPSQGGKKEPRVLVVGLTSNNGLDVSDMTLIDYSIGDVYSKYYFRNPPASQGPAASLSFKLPGKPSALRQRLKILSILGYEADIEKIASNIERKLEELKESGVLAKGIPVLIVLKIDGKWPAENDVLKEKFVENFFEKLGNYGGKQLWKQKGICHGCGKETTVYGGVGNLLKFYTVDKHGYAPELNPKVAWKQYALCRDCIFDLERGRRAVDDFLTWRFYGKNFWLLPVSTGNMRNILDRFKKFHKEVQGNTYKDSFESFEDRLLYEASMQEDALYYHFVFVSKDNQALRILLHIEEILPSVLGEYVSKKQEVERRFHDSVSQTYIRLKKPIRFNFFSGESLRETNQKPGFSEEDFFMLVDRFFRRSPVSERYLLSKAMSRISKDMADTDNLPLWAVMETLLSLEFSNEWGILKRETGGIDMSRLPYDSFFEEHGDFFNHPAKKGLVLLGVLVQKFLDEQYKRRGSTPFIKVLKNLRLDEKDVKKVYVSLQNKMNEYEIGHWWPELREGIGVSFVEAGDKWNLSPEEIGFYIAVGMALHSHPAFGHEQD